MPFELMCDASDFAVGAVLGQRIDEKFTPIYYASKTLNNAQEHYTTTEKELFAVGFTFDKFRPYLILSKITVYTDHSTLKYLFNKQDDKRRLIRWVILLQGFNIEIKDKKGAENLAANHLPRFGVPKALISDRAHFCNSQLERALQKYDVTHKLSTTYHPQSNGQTEVTNRAIKCILERSVRYNHKGMSEKLNDALWAFRTAYKTPTRCTPFRMVYGKACHLLVEIEHKAYWALKKYIIDKNDISFKVNGHRLKIYYEGNINEEDEEFVELVTGTT
ncbi:reverse transcriptase domain-containing protein [Tanacetum coccineum]